MKLRLSYHLVFLVIYVACVYGLLLLPVWVMGYPYEVPNLPYILTFGQASRLLPWVLSFASFPLQDPKPWLQINVVMFVLSIFPLWLLTKRLFDVRIAWIACALYPFIPVHWMQSLRLDGYVFAYVFVLISALFSTEAWKRKTYTGWWIAAAGANFGLAMASRDAFILFLPAISIAMFILGRDSLWKTAQKYSVFLLVCLTFYSVPIAASALSSGGSISSTVQSFLGMQRGTPTILHFYPDQYTYDYEKEEYLESIAEESTEWSTLERLGAANYMQLFGAAERTFVSTFLTGSLLIAGSLPVLISQEYMGGIFLWIFILLGSVYVYRQDRRLLWLSVGLITGLILTIRYGFLAQRTHIMDYAWILVILAAVGLCHIVDYAPSRRTLLRTVLTLVVVVQLLQINRTQIARLYNRSNTLHIYAATTALQQLPENAVVAYPPNRRDYLFLTNISRMQFDPRTIQRLSAERLQFAFDTYNITHTIGYSAGITALLPDSVDNIVIDSNYSRVAPPSKFIEMVLHWFR